MRFLLSNTSRNDSRKTRTGTGRRNGGKEGRRTGKGLRRWRSSYRVRRGTKTEIRRDF